MTSPLIIVDSTTVALTPKPLAAYRPALLNRVTELMMNGRLGEEYEVLHDTGAMDALGLLRAGGYRIAIYRPAGEQRVGMLFWGNGFALTDVKWTDLLDREQGAVFITGPTKKHQAPVHLRKRFVTAGPLRLSSRTIAAAASIHGRVT